MQSRLLICGDSFAAKWGSVNGITGWVDKLEDKYNSFNIAQAGVSEYKIYRQLESQNLSLYNKVIVCHTSPYRIPIKEHPIHKNDTIHYNCDLIYSDVCEHQDNSIMKTAKDFYENILDLEYLKFTHDLIVDKIFTLSPKIIHITFFDYYTNPNILNLSHIFKEHRGNVNHLTEKGNRAVYEIVKTRLNEFN